MAEKELGKMDASNKPVKGFWRQVAMVAVHELRNKRGQMPFPDSKFEFLCIYLGVEFEQFAAACDHNYWWASSSTEETAMLMKRWVTEIGPMVLLGNAAFQSLPAVDAAMSFCNDLWALLQKPTPSFAERLHRDWSNNRPVRIPGEPASLIHCRDCLETHWNDPGRSIIFESIRNLIIDPSCKTDPEIRALVIETFRLPSPDSSEADSVMRQLARHYYERLSIIDAVGSTKCHHSHDRMNVNNVLLAWAECALACGQIQSIRNTAAEREIGIQPIGVIQCARAMARVAMLSPQTNLWEVEHTPHFIATEAEGVLAEFGDEFIESILFNQDVTTGLLNHHAVDPDLIPDPADFLNTLDDPIQWQTTIASR